MFNQHPTKLPPPIPFHEGPTEADRALLRSLPHHASEFTTHPAGPRCKDGGHHAFPPDNPEGLCWKCGRAPNPERTDP